MIRGEGMARHSSFGILVAMSSVILVAHGQDSGAARQFKLKVDMTGSHIPADAVTSSLPLDKRYSELTDEQRRRLKARYEEMKAGDEPPFPEAGLGSLLEPIYKGEKKLLESGPLKLNIYVDARGKGERVEVLASPSPETARFAAGIAMAIKWKPAMCDGRPCPMAFPLRVDIKSRL
jgi:hypothetical protein